METAQNVVRIRHVPSSRRIFYLKLRVNTENKLRFIALPRTQGEVSAAQTFEESAPRTLNKVNEVVSARLSIFFIFKPTELILVYFYLISAV
jgi:hypothetical protein